MPDDVAGRTYHKKNVLIGDALRRRAKAEISALVDVHELGHTLTVDTKEDKKESYHSEKGTFMTADLSDGGFATPSTFVANVLSGVGLGDYLDYKTLTEKPNVVVESKGSSPENFSSGVVKTVE